MTGLLIPARTSVKKHRLSQGSNLLKVSSAHAGETALHLQGDFTWEESAEPSLTNLDAAVNSGDLMVVVGPTGSGKSSLLGAALGLMQQVSGKPVNLRGKASFAVPSAMLATETCRRKGLAAVQHIELAFGSSGLVMQ